MNGNEKTDKPLMQLFRRLIGNDSKQNTVLTNAQILDILHKDLNTEVMYTHDLEIEIYLNVIKKFLKDWPQWDEFDKSVNLLMSKGDIEATKKLLDVKYNNFKDYLKTKLDIAKPLVKDALKRLTPINNDDDKPMNVVMEVNCTRSQLNRLFFRRPNTAYKNTIFNIVEGPSKILLNSISVQAMLNWFHVKVDINLPFFTYRSGMTHILKHILVNKKLNITLENEKELSLQLQRSANRKNSSFVKLDDVLYVLDGILSNMPQDYMNRELIVALINQIQTDLQKNHPSVGLYLTYYRKYLNKYPYVRYLYAEVPGVSSTVNKYDLQLQETVYPIVYYEIGKFARSEMRNKMFLYSQWVKCECILCNKTFSGLDMTEKLKQHILEYHFDEPDWQCTNCKSVFSMINLTERRWEHQC
ncbi:uncharacterized protein LOC113510122 isoform X2 [Galleria mellonella]|uniref:Uncharacterized protein LOC113510122 isoform X2 n=1 Tax=Galleria mellonella TaxID=7137 RepID=A0ABM3MTA3_GALME|nr:uncharacterized protein LOC113510122 isoform X2 [Galleria mellonella]